MEKLVLLAKMTRNTSAWKEPGEPWTQTDPLGVGRGDTEANNKGISVTAW